MSYYTGHQTSLEGKVKKYRVQGPFEESKASHRDKLKFKPVPEDQIVSTRYYYVGFRVGGQLYDVEGPIQGFFVADAVSKLGHRADGKTITLEMES